MALTAEHYQSLEDAGLVKLFRQHRKKFTEITGVAYSYTQTYIGDTGQPVRVDDVAQVLAPALKVDELLTSHLASHRLRQKYWTVWFADLLLDQLWEDLHHAEGTTGDR
jgi:hypothetical protein